MEILIWTDDEDNQKWQVIKDLYNKIVVLQRENYDLEELPPLRVKLANDTSDFWHYIIEKYPYCRNKQIGLNSQDGYIFSYANMIEFHKYSK